MSTEMEIPCKKTKYTDHYSFLIYFKCAACGLFCIYIAWSTGEILALKKEVERLSSNNEEADGIPKPVQTDQEKLLPQLQQSQKPQNKDILQWLAERKEIFHHRVQRSAKRPTSAPHTGKKRHRKRGKCRCPCMKKKTKCRGPRGFKGPKGDKGERGPPGTPGRFLNFTGSVPTTQNIIKAAHYSAKEYNLNMRPVNNAKNCVDQWNGVYCFSNFTFRTKTRSQMMEFLERSGLPNNVASPIQPQGDGRFRIRDTGLYLLYINVQSVVYDVEHEVALYVDHTKSLTCQTSSDIIEKYEVGFKYYRARVKSCSALGAFYLTKNQMISAKIEDANRVVQVRHGTNIGAILISTS